MVSITGKALENFQRWDKEEQKKEAKYGVCNDPRGEFAQELSRQDFKQVGQIIEGKLTRIMDSQDKGKKKSGWYVYHEFDDNYNDGHVVGCGTFGTWRDDITQQWMSRGVENMSPVERQDLQERRKEADVQRKAEEVERHANAAKACHIIFHGANEPAEEHGYLVKKGISLCGKIKQDKGALTIPMKDADNRISSLQYIQPDGTKRYHTGGKIKGTFFAIEGTLDKIYVVEGYATAVSVHMATGCAVYCAFMWSNLYEVVNIAQKYHPEAAIVIAGDDDAFIDKNVGRNKANEVCSTLPAVTAKFPKFSNTDSKPTDWNDLHCLEGLDQVKEQLENEDEWQTPQPIKIDLPAVEAFSPHDLLPEPLASWVQESSERMCCPPDYIASPAIVALSSVIGAKCVIKPKQLDDWAVVPNLWGMIIGQPSQKKSPAISIAVKPLDHLIATAKTEFEKELEEFKSGTKARAARKLALEAAIKKAAKDELKPKKITSHQINNPFEEDDSEDEELSFSDSKEIENNSKETIVEQSTETGEEAANFEDLTVEELQKQLDDFEKNEPQNPSHRRYKSNDATVEMLGELLQANPNGLLVLRDELVGLLASWEKPGKEGDRAFYLEAWNGSGNFDTDRIGRGSIFIPNLCLSLFGGTQPDKLRAFLEKTSDALSNDGAIQRFQLMVYPDPVKYDWVDKLPDKKVRDKVYELFAKLAFLDPANEAIGATPKDKYNDFPYFHFSAEAQKRFIQWSMNLHQIKIANESNSLIEQHLAKYDNLFSSLALIFHLVDCIENNHVGAVSEQAVIYAEKWCHYLESHARRCYALLDDDGAHAAKCLATKLKTKKLEDGFTAYKIKRHGWRGLKSIEHAEAALSYLESKYWVKSYEMPTTQKGGRPTTAYRINPQIFNKNA